MERQQASVTPEHRQVTGRSPLNGMSSGAAAAGAIPVRAT
jgi:hypothetical protein